MSFDLDQPILEFPFHKERTAWTIRNAVEGVQIFGGIGSGKTSGSGRTLALKYLKAGFGGLVLTVKPDEKSDWQEYCTLTGRRKDLIILEPGGPYHFNFLEYESVHAAGQSAITENIVEVLKTVIRAGEEKESGKSDDAFWQSALDLLLFNVIDLCKLAYGSLSLERIYDIVQTAPREGETPLPEKLENGKDNPELKEFTKALIAARRAVREKVIKWRSGLTTAERIASNEPGTGDHMMLEAVPELRVLKHIDQFFSDSFKTLSEKTRSIIDFSFSSFFFRLLREPVYSLLCKGASNVTPEDSLNGKIILLNLPVKLYHKVGRDCQILFKYIWQRAMEKRDVKLNGRPVFLYADEAQHFIHEHDASFQATARSSRIATVYLTQNLPNYYAAMGGEKAQYKVKSFMGTLATKIFHANADIETNTYASELIGEEYVEKEDKSVSAGGKDFSHGRSTSIELERVIRPEEFVRLPTGGRRNGLRVGCILHRQGDEISPGKNYTRINFNQDYVPSTIL